MHQASQPSDGTPPSTSAGDPSKTSRGKGSSQTPSTSAGKQRVRFNLDPASASKDDSGESAEPSSVKGPIASKVSYTSTVRPRQPSALAPSHDGSAMDPGSAERGMNGAGTGGRTQSAVLVLDIEDPDSVLDAEVS